MFLVNYFFFVLFCLFIILRRSLHGSGQPAVACFDGLMSFFSLQFVLICMIVMDELC